MMWPWPCWPLLVAAAVLTSVVGNASGLPAHVEKQVFLERDVDAVRSLALAVVKKHNTSEVVVTRLSDRKTEATASCTPDFDVSPKAVQNCKGAVCITRRYIDAKPTDPEDYNDMHMELGGRACVPEECASEEGLEAVARRMWKRESEMSSRDFGGNGREVTVSLDVDCTPAGGVFVHCDTDGTAVTETSKSLASPRDAELGAPAARSSAAGHKSLLLAAIAAAWGLVVHLS